MSDVIKVLIVEDLPTDAELNMREVRDVLPNSEFLVVETQEDFLAALETFRPDIILSDYKLPHFDGLSALKFALERVPEIPFIIITGSMNEDTAVECMKAGAWNYVIKEHIKRLGPAVLMELERKRIQIESKRADKALQTAESQWQATFDSIGDAISLIDPNGNFMNCNKSMETLLGKSKKDIVGRHYVELLHGTKQPIDGCPVIFSQKTRRRGRRELQIGDRSFEATADPILDAEGNFLSSVCIIADITERKRVQQNLTESQELLSQFIHHSPMYAFIKVVTPEESRFLDVSDNYEELTGIAGRDMIGMTMEQLFPAQIAARITAEDWAVVAGNAALTRDEEIKDRSFITVLFPIVQEDVTLLAGYSIDITERKRMEENVKTVARQWTESFDSINDMITIHDADFNIIRANRAAETALGLSLSEILTRKCFKSYHGADCPPEGCPSCQTLKTGIPSTVEVFEPHLNKFVEIKALPRFGKDHEIIGVVHVVQDISERKQAEMLLIEYQNRIKLILDSVTEGIYGIDLAGNCTFCNPSALSMLGYQNEQEVIGKNMHCLVHHTKADLSPYLRVECIADRSMATGESYHGSREPLWRKDGSSFVAEIWGHPVVKENVIQGMVFSFIDRTEQISLERQLNQAQKMEAVGALAGGIAHDFNNILSAIIGYGYVTLAKMPQNDPLRTNIEHILESADRAASLTKSLLTFSRKQILDRKNMDVNALIRKVEKFLSMVIGEDVAIKMMLSEGELAVFADAGQLEQVFMNFATNARDAMPKGGSFTIETTIMEMDTGFIAMHGYGKPGNFAMITFTDTGVGMNEQTRKKIFEPFFSTKEVGKGTGLGLAIVYGIIKQHDGFVNVYSEPGKGTAFRIYLPLIDAPIAEERKMSYAELPGVGIETILYAEDDSNLRQLTMIVLEQAGYTVIPAVDGEEAVAKFMEQKDSIQFLLLDVNMPKKYGSEICNEIRKINPTIPALFISGYSPDMLCQKDLIDAGADIIHKPVSPLTLMKKIREMLDRQR